MSESLLEKLPNINHLTSKSILTKNQFQQNQFYKNKTKYAHKAKCIAMLSKKLMK